MSDIAAFGRLLFTRLAGGGSGVAVWRLPACDRVLRGPPADAPPARLLNEIEHDRRRGSNRLCAHNRPFCVFFGHKKALGRNSLDIVDIDVCTTLFESLRRWTSLKY